MPEMPRRCANSLKSAASFTNDVMTNRCAAVGGAPTERRILDWLVHSYLWNFSTKMGKKMENIYLNVIISVFCCHLFMFFKKKENYQEKKTG